MGGKWRYGIVLDAGSSGTRLHIYKWLDIEYARKHADEVQLESLPALKTKKSWTKKIHPGISTFGSDPHSVGPDHLDQLLEHALDIIPQEAVPDTPFFLLATAGVRLLPDSQRHDLLRAVCDYTRQTTNFFLPDCGLHIQVIPGETEGLYGWIAANYLLQAFDSANRNDHGKGHHTYGFLDMGGASAQIAFAPNATEAQKHADDLKMLRFRLLNGQTAEYEIFVTTWLGFGVNEARKRYVARLIDHYDPQAHEIPDPCLPTGLMMNRDGKVLPAHSKDIQNETGKLLIGTGQFNECLKATNPLLGKDLPCEEQPCLLNGVHAPAIDFDVNHFVGVSEFWHTTHEVFEMAHKDKSYDFNTYQQQVNEFCSKPWEEIHAGVSAFQWGQKVDAKTALEVCFKASWLINVLHEGIGIPRVTLEDTPSIDANGTDDIIDAAKGRGFLDPFQAVNKIEDVEVSWTLGKMVLYASASIPKRDNGLPVGFGSNVAGIPDDWKYARSHHNPPERLINGTESELLDDPEGSDWHAGQFLGEEPKPAPTIILVLVLIVVLLWMFYRPERRSRILRQLSGCIPNFRRKGGAKSPQKKRKVHGPSGPAVYDRVSGDSTNDRPSTGDIEMGEVDSDMDVSPSEGSRVGRASGWATPTLTVTLDTSSSRASYIDLTNQAELLDLPLPGNPMARSGLIIRNDSKDRLRLDPPSAGPISRNVSPARRSPLSPSLSSTL